MSRYAEGTTVPVERSQAELQRLLTNYGAAQTGFLRDVEAGRAVVLFSLGGRQVRLTMAVPSYGAILEEAAAEPPHGWRSWKPAKREQWARKKAEKIEMARWRSIVLVAKAKLELIAEGVSTVEREFLADIMLPNGETVGEHLSPRLEVAYSSGKMPRLLPPAVTGER